MLNRVEEISAVEVLALSKVIKSKDSKAAREVVDPGNHEVNCLVRLRGMLKVGEDYDQNNTASMPQMKMLLAALMLNGTSVRSFVKRYLDGEFEIPAEKEKEMKEIWSELAENYKSTFKGKVTAVVEVEKVEEVE